MGKKEFQMLVRGGTKSQRIIENITERFDHDPLINARKVLFKQKVGIEKLKRALIFGVGLLDDIQKARSESSPGGKQITFGEGLLIGLKNTPGVFETIKNIGEFGIELADLDKKEKEELIEFFSERFKLSEHHFVEVKIEIIFAALVSIYLNVKMAIFAWREVEHLIDEAETTAPMEMEAPMCQPSKP